MGLLASYIELMRPKQWVKNLFVAVPLFFSGRLLDSSSAARVLGPFIVFCLVSSAVYIVNDLCDRAADAAHPKKRLRPIASGAVSPVAASALLVLVSACALAVFLFLAPSAEVGWVIVAYLAVNFSYSFGLKHVGLLELFLVASGFVLRLIAGGAVLAVPLSSWILVMTGVVALLIATSKRRAEIADGLDPDSNRRSLNAYNLVYLDSMISMLSGVLLIVYLLFTTSEYAAGRFGQGPILLTAPVVAFGVMRFVQVTKVGSGADDPTTLILKDPAIRYAGLILGLLYVFILYVNPRSSAL